MSASASRIHLTTGQQALLRSELQVRLGRLDRQLGSHLGGKSRAEHAAEVLQQDAQDFAEHGAEREIDLALADRETVEIGEVSAAIQRLDEGGYGGCEDCGVDIPFDRLKVEPWARRCVACEGAREAQARR